MFKDIPEDEMIDKARHLDDFLLAVGDRWTNGVFEKTPLCLSERQMKVFLWIERRLRRLTPRRNHVFHCDHCMQLQLSIKKKRWDAVLRKAK